MGVTRQLNQLQEIDLEIESKEQTLTQKVNLLGDKQVLEAAQNKLALEQQQLDELRHQQQSAEWEIDDISSKITSSEKQLYGGKIFNPKELSGLQSEVVSMKTKKDQLETRTLEIIDRVEATEKGLAAAKVDFKKLEEDWHGQQHQLSDDIEQLKTALSDLKQKRQQLSAEIDVQALDLYEKLRKHKKPPIARVEQGICRACRISISSSQIQRVRSGDPTQCNSCGRILFLP